MIDDKYKPYSICPKRSPKAVSEAIKDIIAGKVVCELGAGVGDNMMFMSLYAKEVIGFEYAAVRYEIAHQRGLNVIVGDYFKDDLPEAEVYYFWPDKALKDNEYLMRKILSNENFWGTIIIAADSGAPAKVKEVYEVERCAKISGGRIMKVPFNEGNGRRQRGVMTLAIIDAKRASL